MKAAILTKEGKSKGDISLPVQFQEPVRPDLIKRAVLVTYYNRRQPYGAHPEAGKRASAKLSRRRRDYKTSYGFGISRVPRKILSGRGSRFNWVGAVAPNTVGGRRAHPPKAEKVWKIKINKKERRKAIRSAISASIDKELVIKRGHKLADGNYPLVIESAVEMIEKTKEVLDLLLKIGLSDELERTKEKKIRAGKGKMRGRKYKKKVGPLLVVSGKCPLLLAAKNIPGVHIVPVHKLNAAVLAPATVGGRLTIYSEAAIERLEKERLFTDHFKMALPSKQKQAKPKKEKTQDNEKKTSEKSPSLQK